MPTYRFIHKETMHFTAAFLATVETQTTKSYNMFNEEFHLETSKIEDEVMEEVNSSPSRLYVSVGTLMLPQSSAWHEDTVM